MIGARVLLLLHGPSQEVAAGLGVQVFKYVSLNGDYDVRHNIWIIIA